MYWPKMTFEELRYLIYVRNGTWVVKSLTRGHTHCQGPVTPLLETPSEADGGGEQAH